MRPGLMDTRRWLPAAIIAAALLSACVGQAEPARLILATTTSTQDSGLLDAILPDFETQYNATVDVIAVGTGQALETAGRGDADVALVHDAAREQEFVESGQGLERHPVMYNDFIIVGPVGDPAGVGQTETAAQAFTAIAESEAAFISRGDESGTHARELSLWEDAGIDPAGQVWYMSAGQGMGAVLTLADESQAYTLSDRATYLARRQEGLSLAILLEGDPALLNPYSVIAVNPALHPNVNADLAAQFVEWITSLETQELIASFLIGGEQVFFPDSELWRAAHP